MYVNRITLVDDYGSIEVTTEEPFDQSVDREFLLYDNLSKKYVRFRTKDILLVKTIKTK